MKLKCTRYFFHNFDGRDDDSKCQWCGKTLYEVKTSMLKKKGDPDV